MKNSNNQYPAQTGKYAVKVKYGGGWSSFKTARFHISVGQEYHEGEKFKATMDWAKHRFEKVVICVNDTLQRHNYAYSSDLSSEEAFRQSEAMGEEWIQRNLPVISQLPNCELYRWEDWRGREDYTTQYNYIVDLYNKVPVVKAFIDEEVMIFWKRRSIKTGEKDYSFTKFKEASIQYLLEETAAFFLMFKKDVAADIYPGSALLPCVLAQKYCEGLKAPLLSGRAFTRIDFSRNDLAAANSNQASS